MVKIIKKNGEEVAFNGEKIKRAIRKSANRVCVTLTDKEEKKIVDTVKKQLQFQETSVNVSTIHNMVEVALDNVNSDVAKSYREFRDNKSAFSSMLDKVYSKKLSLNFIGDRSNANSDSALVTTQKAIVYNELNSELYKKFFLTQKEERAMSDGYIYVHDRGSRLDTINCCLFDMPTLLKDGFFMGNLDYQEPKSLDVAFDLIGDVTMNAAASQYGGFTISQIDKVLAPYAEKSYNIFFKDYISVVSDKDVYNVDLKELVGKITEEQKTKADKYAMDKLRREFEQGFQSWEMKFNSVASSRGDYPFTAITFGLGTGRFETMASSIAMKVRKNGQGKKGFKHPVLFPKINFFYDEELHGPGKQLEWLFEEAIDCASKAMYPDFISCTGDGYDGDMYKKYGTPISKMGCIDYTEKITICNKPSETKGGVQPHTVMIGEFYNHILNGNKPREFASTRVKNIVREMKDKSKADKFLKYGYMFFDGEQMNQWAISFKQNNGRRPTRGDVEEFFGRPLDRKSIRVARGINSQLFDLWDSYLELKVVDLLKKNGYIEETTLDKCTTDKHFIRNKFWKTLKSDKNESTLQIDIFFPTRNLGFEVEDFATHSKDSNTELYLINGFVRSDKTFKKGPSYFEMKKSFFSSIGINVIELWEDEIRNGSFIDILNDSLGIKLNSDTKVERVISEIHTSNVDYIDLEALGIIKYVKDIDGSYTRILRLVKNNNVKDWLLITLENGNQLTVTSDHPFITENGQVPASELISGQTLIDVNDNDIAIDKIEAIDRCANSYDIETESHTFVFSGIQSHNCRANLSPWYIRGGMEPADEDDRPVFEGRFNMGAISLHFPMIVAKAKKEDKDFYEVLDYYLEMTRSIHKRTFDFLSHKKAGINPLGFCQGGFLNGHKNPDEELGEDFLRPMTISFGITALNEASILATGKTIVEDNSWAIDVLKHINDYVSRIKKEDNILYAIYGTPAESLCHTQVEQFKKKYGIVKNVSDHEYTSNSFHCCVREDITPIQKQDIEYPMYHLCSGGRIQYVRYRLPYNLEAIKTLVRRAMKMGFYEGINFELDFCEDCGQRFTDSDKCPKCGSEHITRIERMNGYLGYSKVRGNTMYADHKLTEFSERKSM